MKLVEVMDEIGEALKVLPGLRIYTYEVGTIATPAAIVQAPNMDYDQAFQRGVDRWEGGIMVAVSKAWDRAARNNIAAYIDGRADTSIHAALLARTVAGEWQSCDYARATNLRWMRQFEVGGVQYVTARIGLDIAGPGS